MNYKQEPRGIRNNNPLNLKKSTSRWKGKLCNDGTFEIFKNASFGFRAAYKNIQTWLKRKPGMTLQDLIFLWCPDSTKENYLKSVVLMTKFSPTDRLVLYSWFQYARLLEAMCRVENGICPYTLQFIFDAIHIK